MAEDVFDYWFPWYPARFKKKTLHLTLIQRAIYRELIDFYMETRSPLPDSDIALARIIGISVDEFSPHSGIIREYFKVKKQGKITTLFHPTCEGLLREQEERAEIRKNRAKKGGKAKAEKDNKNNGDSASSRPQADSEHATASMLQDSTVQYSTVQDKKESLSSEPIVSKTHTSSGSEEKDRAHAFSEFWGARPGRGKDPDPQGPALEAFEKLIDAGEDPAKLIAAMRRYAAQAKSNTVAGTRYAKSASRFLTEGHWKQYAQEVAAEPAALAPEPLPDWLQPMTKLHDEARLRSWFKDVTFADGKITAPTKFIADRIRAEFAQGLLHCFKDVEIVVKPKGGKA